MPFIDRDFINDLSNRVDIIGLINKRVPLKRQGKTTKPVAHFMKKKHHHSRWFPVNRFFIASAVAKVAE